MRHFNTIESSTKKLHLVAATLEHVLAELEDIERLASLLNADIDPDWPPGEYDRSAQEYFRDRLREGGSAVIGWYGWYALQQSDPDHRAILIGAGGYLGPPDQNGDVAIGFSVVPKWRNLGYATEIAEFLVTRAFADPRVRKVVAQTTPANMASRKVLEKAHLVCSRSRDDSNSLHFEIYREG